MPTEYLGTAAVAEHVGLSVATIRSYILKGIMPEADVIITTPSGALRGWAPATIDAWQASRPGQGARTDLTQTSSTPSGICELVLQESNLYFDRPIIWPPQY